MGYVRTLVVVRHGLYPHNTMIDEEGDKLLARYGDLSRYNPAQLKAIQLEVVGECMKLFPADHDATAHISPEGVRQAESTRNFLEREGWRQNVAVCLTSPLPRVQDTTRILFEGMSVRCEADDKLRERDLGVFTHVPRRVFHNLFPDWSNYKAADPLFYRSARLENGKLVPLAESHADRLPALQEVLKRADREAPGGIAVLSTHADTMAEFRMLPRLWSLQTNAQLKRSPAPGLDNPLWIQNCEVDVYEERRAVLTGRMTHVRNVVCHGEYRRDTGWVTIPR